MGEAHTPLTAALTVEQLWQPVPGGSGTYVRELAHALRDRTDVRPVGIRARGGRAPDAAWSLDPRVPTVASALPRAALYESWTRLRRPRTWRQVRGLDVVHATTWALPPVGPPLVVTVHDLAFLRSPEHFTARGNAFFRAALDVVRREASAVIAVSETTRQDCLEAGIPADRLHVVAHGVREPEVTSADVETFRAVHGLERPYVLWCGTVEPRKNVASLLRAYAALLHGGSDLDLVLVGPAGWGDATEVTAELAALPQERVHRLGMLPTADLAAAYAGARVFCFPSLWEGFGMPVLEAMSHGTPVVTSAGTSMAEFVGGGGLLVDPRDVEEIAQAITSAAHDEYDHLSTAARVHAATFSWEAAAEATVAVYRAAIESPVVV